MLDYSLSLSQQGPEDEIARFTCSLFSLLSLHSGGRAQGSGQGQLPETQRRERKGPVKSTNCTTLAHGLVIYNLTRKQQTKEHAHSGGFCFTVSIYLWIVSCSSNPNEREECTAVELRFSVSWISLGDLQIKRVFSGLVSVLADTVVSGTGLRWELRFRTVETTCRMSHTRLSSPCTAQVPAAPCSCRYGNSSGSSSFPA